MEGLSKVGFALTQYLWLAGLLLAACGAGAPLVDRCDGAAAWPKSLRASVTLAVGLGVLVLALLALAILDAFRPIPVAAVLLAAMARGALRVAAALDSPGRRRLVAACPTPGGVRWFWTATAVLIALPFFVKPLQPPLGWDGLMYHLPHAKVWAEAGTLAIATWVRYPLFPYNFDLLYAASLLFGNDVFPHLIHGLAGALVTVGLAAAGTRYFGRAVGVLASLMFLAAAGWGFEVAYIDLGLTLFIAFSFAALALWYEGDDHWLAVLAALLLGLAVGTKYQALLFVPIVGFWIALRARTPALYAGATAAFLLGGSFWYIRSFLVSGDPLHPFGAPLFGYWLWNQADLAGQYADIRSRSGLPQWYMLPALLAPLFLRGSSGTYRALCASGLAALAFWGFSSRYERYLMPAYPLLALMSSSVVIRTAGMIGLERFGARFAQLPPPARAGALATVLIVVASWSLGEVRRHAGSIPATPALRDAILRRELAGYELFMSLPADRQWRLYQFGFEGELYHSPVPVVGDWFGPARYRQVYARADDPAALAEWLGSMGLNGLVVNSRRSPFSEVGTAPGFSDRFELLVETPSARLYGLRASGSRVKEVAGLER